MVRLGAVDVPALPPTAGVVSLAGGAPLAEFVQLEPDETVIALCSLSADGPGLAIGTADGVVKRVVPDYPARDAWDVVALKDGDRVVGVVELESDGDELVFVTSDAQLLHFGASVVRPQGRAAGGVAGVALAAGSRVVFFGAVAPGTEAEALTIAGSSSALPGTQTGSAKVTPFGEYPGKGRSTGGVRCHRFLRGEDSLLLACVGPAPVRAVAAGGGAVDLPPAAGRRDGSGTPLAQPVHAAG
jgi:DNA gyrase subunit A